VLNGYARVKLDKADAQGKRYRSPLRTPNRLYIPPILDRKLLADPALPLWLTEGEKKALKACQEGLACIAASGVWSWKTRDADDKSVPVADLDAITWRGRVVYIVFDSDLAQNPSVKLAEFRLPRARPPRGARAGGAAAWRTERREGRARRLPPDAFRGRTLWDRARRDP
jgi:putative DNA primase/helicase